MSVKKPYLEPLRWAERVVCVMWHLFPAEEGPGMMLNVARQPEPSFQHALKQKCAGRRARRRRASAFLPLRNISDKAQ